MSTWIKEGGSWKEATEEKVKINGKWVETTQTYIKVNGKWEDPNAMPISFQMEVTSADEPTVYSVVGGNAVVVANGAGEWIINFYGTVTEFLMNENKTTITTNRKVTKIKVTKNLTVNSLHSSFVQLSSMTSFEWGTGVKSDTITNLRDMFENSGGTFTWNDFDFSNVTTTSYMFYGWKGTSLDVSGMDFTALTDMSHMFEQVLDVVSIKMPPNSKMPKVSCNLKYLFINCPRIVCISNLDTIHGVPNDSLFHGSNALTSPDKATQTKLESPAGFAYDKGSPC